MCKEVDARIKHDKATREAAFITELGKTDFNARQLVENDQPKSLGAMSRAAGYRWREPGTRPWATWGECLRWCHEQARRPAVVEDAEDEDMDFANM